MNIISDTQNECNKVTRTDATTTEFKVVKEVTMDTVGDAIPNKNCKIVTWAANTTGSTITDEICELAAYDGNSSFSQYIIPHCNVKYAHWKRHGLKECNTKIIRVLKDYRTHKILNTKSEIYGLKDFLSWLEKINETSAEGIILVYYDYHNYALKILLESLYKYTLFDQFSKIIKGFVNCYDISEKKYGRKIKNCTLHNINKMIFEEADLTRALSRAQTCYKIILHIGNSEIKHIKTIDNYQNNENNIVKVVTPYINNFPIDKDEEKQHIKVKALEEKHTSTRKKSRHKKKLMYLDSDNEKESKIQHEHKESIITEKKLSETEKESSSFAKCLPYELIGWAINTTGYRFGDELLHIAAFSPSSTFDQYVMPKKNIKYNNKYNIKVIKVDETRHLKNIRTQEILNTKSEILVLKDFLQWLEEIKGDKTEGLILLHHDYQQYNLAIFLESLQRHNFIDHFSSIVKGFVNTYILSQDKCGNITKLYTLNKICELLLKKKIEVRNAVAKAQACYDITFEMAKRSTGNEDDLQIMTFISPYISSIPEEKELAQVKATVNKNLHIKHIFRRSKSTKHKPKNKDSETNNSDSIQFQA